MNLVSFAADLAALVKEQMESLAANLTRKIDQKDIATHSRIDNLLDNIKSLSDDVDQKIGESINSSQQALKLLEESLKKRIDSIDHDIERTPSTESVNRSIAAASAVIDEIKKDYNETICEFRGSLDEIKSQLSDYLRVIDFQVAQEAQLQEIESKLNESLATLPQPKDGRDGRDGKDGKDGKDGRNGVDCNSAARAKYAVQQIDERNFALIIDDDQGQVQTCKFSIPALIYRNVWKDGERYQQGDTVTFGGSLWHCDTNTDEKPGQSKHWTLCVKKGRDSK